MPSALDKVELEAMMLLRQMSLMTSRRDRSLDRSAYMVLSCLMSGGAMTVTQLGNAMGLDASTLSRQTNAMVSRGLVERLPDPNGGIARRLRPTQVGTDALVATCTANMAVLREATVTWELEELQEFARYLERFNRGLEETANLSWPRPTSSTFPSAHDRATP